MKLLAYIKEPHLLNTHDADNNELMADIDGCANNSFNERFMPISQAARVILTLYKHF